MHIQKLLAAGELEKPLDFDDFERGALIGLLIGEGTVTLTTIGRTYYSPEVKLSNTDVRIVEWVHELFARVGLQHHVSKMKAHQLRKPHHRLQYMISVQGLVPVFRLLTTLRTGFFAKAEKVDIVLAFIALRIEACHHHGRFGNPRRSTEKDQKLVSQIRLLNARGVADGHG